MDNFARTVTAPFLLVLVVLIYLRANTFKTRVFRIWEVRLFTAKMLEGVDSKRSICKSKNLLFLEIQKKSARPASYAAKADTHLLSIFQGPTYALVNGPDTKI